MIDAGLLAQAIPHFPALIVVLPLAGAVLTTLIRSGTRSWMVAVAVAWALPVMAVHMLLQVMGSGTPISYEMGGWPAPFGIVYHVDILSAFVLIIISGAGAVIMPFARKSVATEILPHQQSWYYTMYLLCLSGLLGITITGDAFNAFVFMEVSSLATYVLIAMGQHRRALLAAFQYLIMGTIGATLYVIGIGILFLVTGTLNFVDMAARLSEMPSEMLAPVMTALGFVFVGVSLKLALFPLHLWLPNAYTYAPSFATAFLAGTATKAAVYLLIRLLFSVFGVSVSFASLPVSEAVMVLSIAAMFLASLAAIYEPNVKRMMAYSSVAQIGYITLGIALANRSGLTGAMAHMMNHAVMKTALFLALGAVFYRIGSVRLKDMAGIGRTMPLTMAAFVVAGIGLMGTPGTAGFISKWYLAMGALEKDWWWLVFLIVASSLLSVVYIGRLVESIWMREPGGNAATASDPPLSMLLPLYVLAAATIYLGFDTRVSVEVAGAAAEQLLGGLK